MHIWEWAIVNKFMEKKLLGIIIWTLFFINIVLTVYVNYCLPHGLSYSTGDIVCQNDGRGPCGESYREDLSQVDIPDWAKFIRSNGIFLFFVLGIAGVIVSNKNENE